MAILRFNMQTNKALEVLIIIMGFGLLPSILMNGSLCVLLVGIILGSISVVYWRQRRV
jgi:hypothetical protein